MDYYNKLLAEKEVKLLCKQNVSEERLNLMYDNLIMNLTKDKWYKVIISTYLIRIYDDNNYSFCITPSDVMNFFYSEHELRKIKIKNILN